MITDISYRIPKDRFPVALRLAGGTRLVGAMFIQGISRTRSGREEPTDIMNEADPFFPFVSEQDETFLIAKDRVSEVELLAPMDDDSERHAGARLVDIEMSLVGGESRRGSMLLETPSDRPRLLDFLNRTQERFVLLHNRDGVRLINRSLIERIRPLDSHGSA